MEHCCGKKRNRQVIKLWLIERFFSGLQLLIIVMVASLIVSNFVPTWWEVNQWSGDPPKAFIDAIRAEIQQTEQFRWITVGLLGALWLGIAYGRDRITTMRYRIVSG
jgi:hypothetical protein